MLAAERSQALSPWHDAVFLRNRQDRFQLPVIVYHHEDLAIAGETGQAVPLTGQCKYSSCFGCVQLLTSLAGVAFAASPSFAVYFPAKSSLN